MNVIIKNSGGEPIYEQIARQIKQQIISGELESGAALPSMRLLAKELRISVITTKRAYEELERAGFISTMAGKGCFVAAPNAEFMREEQLRKMEEFLQIACNAALMAGVSCNEMCDVVKVIYDAENGGNNENE